MSANWKPSGTAAAPVGDDARLRERPTWAELDEAHARIEALARELAAERKSRTEWSIEQANEIAVWVRKLAAAERCIRAADKAIPEIARQGGLIDCDYELCSVLEANYDAARAGVTLSADSGGEGGV